MNHSATLLVASCLALLPAARADYQAEASLRYGPLHTELGIKEIAASSLEVLKHLNAERTDAVGLSFTHYEWNNTTDLAVFMGPFAGSDPLVSFSGIRFHIHSHRDSLMGSYRHQWSLKPGLSVYGCLRVGANQGHNEITLLPSGIVTVITTTPPISATPSITSGTDTIIPYGAYVLPVSSRLSTALCAETELGVTHSLGENWNASLGLIASCLESRSGSEPLQGIQAKAGLACRF